MSDIEAGFLAAPVALLVTRHRVMVEFNDTFMAMFGYPRETMRNQSVRMLYPTISDYEAIGARAESWLRSHADHQDERFMQRRDGEIFMVRAHGRTMTPHDPFALMTWVFAEAAGRQSRIDRLTRREREIANHIVNGRTCKEIGRLLGISHRTVEAHRGAVMRKVNARNTADLVSKVTLT
ncbi:MAG: LuxR C-terminal-related transcriptional regulator [Gemmobacter sp.]